MTTVITIRMPAAWRGKVDDPQLAKWLREYEQRRPLLAADPGPGTFKRSFRLDKKIIEKLADGDLSAFFAAPHCATPVTFSARGCGTQERQPQPFYSCPVKAEKEAEPAAKAPSILSKVITNPAATYQSRP